jgi:hypothetical protein
LFNKATRANPKSAASWLVSYFGSGFW